MDPIEAYQRENPEHAQGLNRLAELIATERTVKGKATALYAKAAHYIAKLPEERRTPAQMFFQRRLSAFEAF